MSIVQETTLSNSSTVDSSAEPSVMAFRQNYSDIDSATNDLLITQKNTLTAQKSFLLLVEEETKKIGISFTKREPYFPSPLDNSCQSDLIISFNDVSLAKASFFCKGKELNEIHNNRGSSLNPRSYPVTMEIAMRDAQEIAYEFELDVVKDARGITAITRPFKHIMDGQPYHFAFDDSGNISKQESQINRVHDHFNTTIAQLLFAVRQLGIEKREPTFSTKTSETIN